MNIIKTATLGNSVKSNAFIYDNMLRNEKSFEKEKFKLRKISNSKS
jgi:hypothetical protein